jgi:hypothetical protein
MKNIKDALSDFPGIKRAALEIAYDNGGINRFRPEVVVLHELEQFLARQPSELLPDIDGWLSGLSDADLETVCCGEESDQLSLVKTAPPFTHQLLDDYFNEVC